MEKLQNQTPAVDAKPAVRNSGLRRTMLRVGLIVSAVTAACMSLAVGEFNIDYTTDVTTFATYVKTMITDNVGVLLGIMALAVGFTFIWRHVRGLARSI